MLPVIIMAGGLATRLGNVTRVIPKSMIDIGGRPFIDYQLLNLKSQGVSDIIICIGHMGEQIEKYVGNGANWGLNIIYSRDGSTLLGTGGALKKAAKILNKDFILIYGDSYLTVDIRRVENFFNNSPQSILMTIFKNCHQYDVSNVHFGEGKIYKYSKSSPDENMKYIDYGLLIFSIDYFNAIKSPRIFDLSELLEEASINDLIYGYPVENRFFEIGSLGGIVDFNNFILNKGAL